MNSHSSARIILLASSNMHRWILGVTSYLLISSATLRAGPPLLPAWTFMVFLNGDNNLESAALTDFIEMSDVGSTAEVNIVVQMDRTTDPPMDYGDWSGTKRFRIEKNMLPVPESAAMDLGEVNMGDPQALKDFLDWSMSTYPAQRYALVIWDHGDGWKFNTRSILVADNAIAALEGFQKSALLFDKDLITSTVTASLTKTWANYEVLELPQNVDQEGIATTDQVLTSPVKGVSNDDTDGDQFYNREIQDCLLSYGNNKFQLVGFDACLMSMVETAYALRDAANVLVGSEELEPNAGWDYTLIMSALVGNPAMEAEQLGRAIVNCYQASYGNRQATTLACTRLRNIKALATSIGRMADLMIASIETEYPLITRARANCMEYAPGYSLHGIDLRTFLFHYAQIATNTDIKAAIEQCMTNLDACVIQRYASSIRDFAPGRPSYGSYGIAIYFPRNGLFFTNDPDGPHYTNTNGLFPVQFVQDLHWDDFLAAYYRKVAF